MLARELVKRGLGLVYGGSVVGIMGAIANAMLADGGRVIGVIPELLQKKALDYPWTGAPPLEALAPVAHYLLHSI